MRGRRLGKNIHRGFFWPSTTQMIADRSPQMVVTRKLVNGKKEARMEGYFERRLFEHTRSGFGKGPARPMPSTRQSSRPNGSLKQIQSSP
jgi:hypothetical protein